MVNKIYTRAGDKGETSLGSERVPKDDARVSALGDIDELSSAIGMCKDKEIAEELEQVQRDLFVVGAILLGREAELKDRVKELEASIDKYSQNLPELKGFILPEGCLHLARAVCRRAERSVVKISKQEDVLAYLNRLSDYLFVLARYANSLKGLTEKTWE